MSIKTKKAYKIFIWHGFFLTLTMSMIDFNTVFPSLIFELQDSKIIFGLLYSIMLGAPKLFNMIFSHFMNPYKYRKKFLLTGIYIRAFSFLGMAFFVYKFAATRSTLVTITFFFWIFLFATSGGFAGISYSDIIAKIIKKGERGKLYASKQFAAGIAALLGGIVVTKIFAPGNFAFPVNYALILFIGFAGLIIASAAFWFIDEPPSINRDKEKISLRDHFKKLPLILKEDKIFLSFLIVENMSSFSLMILPFYIVFAREKFGIAGGYIGRYLIFQILGTILSNIVWGYISKKLGSKMVVSFCVLAGGLVPIIAILMAPLGPDYFVLIFFLVGFLKSGRLVGFDPYLLDLAPDDRRTIYLGIRGTLNFMVVLLPIFGGVFIDLLGFYFTFVMVSMIMFIAFYLNFKKNPDCKDNC